MSAADSRQTVPVQTDGDRRDFLAKCGKFAVVTSPAVTLLLDASMASASGYVSPGAKKMRRRRRRKRKNVHFHYHFYDKKPPKSFY